MQVDIFPNEYDQQIDEEIENEVALASEQSLERIQQLQNQKVEVKKRQINGAEIGLIFGSIVCIYIFACLYVWVCSSMNWKLGLGCGALTYLIILLIFWFIDNAIYKGKTIHNKEIDKQIDIEKEKTENELQDIRSEGERKKKSYRQAFDEKAQNMSAEFSNSYLVNNVSEWMTNAFFNMINAGDRRPYIQKVSVSFEFDVFPNQITCNLGVYDFERGLKESDFELERCSNLNTPLEQTALARAIASAVKLNTVMYFPKDPSGSDIFVEIDYKYVNKGVYTTICYSADNLYYKDKTSWYEKTN